MKRLSAALSAVLLSAAFAIFLSSCHYGGDTYILSGAAKEENKNFESLSIPFVSVTDDNVLATVFARVYDKNEYIP